MFNGSDAQTTEGYFTFGDGKHNFNTKFQGKYDGVDFTQGLKMEGTTLVAFTSSYPSTLTVVQSTWSEHTLKFDNSELDLSAADTPDGSEGVRVYTLSGVPSGDHQLTRGSGESGIFWVRVKYAGSNAIEATADRPEVVNTEFFNLQGQHVSRPTHGVYVQVQTFSDGKRRSRTVVSR